jgi:hypothetical protein
MSFINRCIAINKNNKRCRAKNKNNSLFCCESHYPINTDIITDGCCMCLEKISNSNDILYFQCKHAFHKPCYKEWLEYSTYESSICLICRSNIYKEQKLEKKLEKNNKILDSFLDISHLTKIYTILKL